MHYMQLIAVTACTHFNKISGREHACADTPLLKHSTSDQQDGSCNKVAVHFIVIVL